MCVVLMLLCVSIPAIAQNINVTINADSSPLINVIEQIEKQTDYHFIYNKDVVDLNHRVTLKTTNEPVESVLPRLFAKSNISFDVRKKQIVLSNKKSSDNSQKGVKVKISGIVSDANGDPLVGVSITSSSVSGGVATNLDGEYTWEVPEGSTLEYKYIGFKPVTLKVSKTGEVNVKLEEDAQILDEVVVVGYGTQRRGNLTGSVSSLNSKDLTVTPVATASNALVGKMPGLMATQTSGQPGEDSASLSIRGFESALVIVDGVEGGLNQIDANQIESISILKDGAASIYGARAGNGVILITTKRGIEQKPTITLSTSFSWQGATKMLKPASAGQRSEMEREAWIQSGQPASSAPFTAEQVQKYYEGTDPAYPNTDWYSELIRDWAPEQQHNISVRGGSKKIKYYAFFGYLDQKTMIKKNGGGFKRYNLQSNVDASIFDNLTLQLDLAYTQEDREYTVRGFGAGGDIWQDYWTTLPYYPASLPDPTKVSYAYGAGTGGLHVSSNRDLSGYNDARWEEIKGTVSLVYNFKYLPGLSFRLFENYRRQYRFSKRWQKPVELYTYEPTSDIYTLAGTYGDKASLSQQHDRSEMFTQQYSFNYENTFNQDHKLSAMALFEMIDYKSDMLSASRKDYMMTAIEQMFAGSTDGMTNDGSASEMGRKSFVARLNYNYANRYLIETIFRADASAKFPPGKRWGYFPSVSLGWVASNEKFLENAQWMDNLKLRASYGQSGNDGVGNFQYLAAYEMGHTYLFGDTSVRGLQSTGLANPYLTWEKMKIYNAGVDFAFFRRKLYGEADVFYRERSGIPAIRNRTVPSTFGADLPPENVNAISNRGFEVKVGTYGEVSGLTYDISGTISWSRAKWKSYGDPVYTDPDQERINKVTGKYTDCVFGYVSDGLFTSQDEIDAAPYYEALKGNSTLRIGDVKYKDLNGDNKIDWRDQKEIGSGTMPHWIFGLTTGFKYKGFDLTMLFQGSFGYSQNISNNDLYSTVLFEERWTEQNNNANAIYPRLGGASSNKLRSDYNYKKAGYLRLKVASLGYTLPQKWMGKCYISNARLYLSGTNLFTINRLGKYGVDPEAPNAGAYYPQQRTISVGLNVSF
ncbi:MAG: TonB-dependent receptor [Clostridiales bacterium]|nr:TonB-dependent receptor [Clostridiales bacterium]